MGEEDVSGMFEAMKWANVLCAVVRASFTCVKNKRRKA